MNILGCRVNEPLIASWEQRLVFEREPVFVTPAERRWLPAGSVVLTGAELRDNYAMAPLDLHDSYNLYAMQRQGLEVAFLTPAEFWDLSEEARQGVMALQAERGRGQIYTEGWLRKLGVTLATGQRDRFTLADGFRFALRHDFWWSLSPEERRRWLQHFVAEGRESCLSSRLRPDQWEQIDQRHGPQIRLLAGTFAPTSGPNCFATVLAAVTSSPNLAASIAGHWLHPVPMLRGLAERGFELSTMPGDPEALPAGAVVLLVDDERRPQHAFYCLGDGLALNKDAQSWFTPRQIRPVAEILRSWITQSLRAHVYIRR